MGQVTNSQQVIHLTYTHRVCTLRFCRVHGRWVRYVRPFVQDFFMQGNGRSGTLWIDASVIYLNDRLLVKSSFNQWHVKVTRLLCWVRQGWNLKNMTDSTWIFCLRNAFACLEYNHPRDGWGCEKKKFFLTFWRKKKPERRYSPQALGATGVCAIIRHSPSWNEKQKEVGAHSSDPKNCKQCKGKRKICGWNSLYKLKRVATAGALDL